MDIRIVLLQISLSGVAVFGGLFIGFALQLLWRKRDASRKKD